MADEETTTEEGVEETTSPETEEVSNEGTE